MTRRVNGTLRPETISLKALTRLHYGVSTLFHEKPLRRGDCKHGIRPCPFAGCKYHLYIDVMPTGAIKFNFPDRELEEIPHTCALDLAEGGGMTLEEVGRVMNVTRERIRQVEDRAKKKLKLYAIRQKVLGV